MAGAGKKSVEKPIQVNEIVWGLAELMDPEAYNVIKENITAVCAWLYERIDQLGLIFGDGVAVLSLNDYNKNGLGIQSVNVGFKRHGSDMEVRPGNEFQDPTIGVIASGMVQDATQVDERSFAVATGRRERIKIGTEGLKMGTKSRRDGAIAKKLGSEVVVDGPDEAAMILEIAGNGTKEDGPDVLTSETNRGVYFCLYEKMDSTGA